MFKNIKEDRGSLAVEVAIFLPIFIIGIATLGYLIKVLDIQENVYHSFNDEMRKTAAYASFDSASIFLPYDVEKRLDKENASDIKATRVEEYSYSKSPDDGMISANLSYDIRVKLPLKIYGDIPISDRILCRAFVGGQAPIDPMPFEDMEKEEESITVWVFPRSGERYHIEDCPYIKVHPKERLLTENIRSIYSPCKLCKPSNIPNGSLIYCFNTGNVYHLGSCTVVDRYVVSMEKTEAQKRGYTPCMKCGGG